MAAGIKVLCENFIFKLHPSDTFRGNQSRTSYLTSPQPPAVIPGVPRQSKKFSAERKRVRQRQWARELESFHCFSYDSFHVLIPLRLLLGDFLHHLTRQICAQRSKKPAGRSISHCQRVGVSPLPPPPCLPRAMRGCVKQELRAGRARAILNICLAVAH